MAKKSDPTKLSKMQEMFVQCYLADPKMNAAQAAMRAGYAESTAYSQASTWVGTNRETCPPKMHHVWDAVHAALEARRMSVKVEAQDILIMLKEMAEADIAEAFDENGELREIKDMPKALRNLLTGMDVFEVMDEDSQRLASRTKKPRFTKKLEVIELLGKHIGVQAFKERVDHHHEVDIVEAIRRGRKRAGKPVER